MLNESYEKNICNYSEKKSAKRLQFKIFAVYLYKQKQQQRAWRFQATFKTESYEKFKQQQRQNSGCVPHRQERQDISWREGLPRADQRQA